MVERTVDGHGSATSRDGAFGDCHEDGLGTAAI